MCWCTWQFQMSLLGQREIKLHNYKTKWLKWLNFQWQASEIKAKAKARDAAELYCHYLLLALLTRQHSCGLWTRCLRVQSSHVLPHAVMKDKWFTIQWQWQTNGRTHWLRTGKVNTLGFPLSPKRGKIINDWQWDKSITNQSIRFDFPRIWRCAVFPVTALGEWLTSTSCVAFILILDQCHDRTSQPMALHPFLNPPMWWAEEPCRIRSVGITEIP